MKIETLEGHQNINYGVQAFLKETIIHARIKTAIEEEVIYKPTIYILSKNIPKKDKIGRASCRERV